MTSHLIFADNKLIFFFSKPIIVDKPCPSILWKACILGWFIRFFSSTALYFPASFLHCISRSLNFFECLNPCFSKLSCLCYTVLLLFFSLPFNVVMGLWMGLFQFVPMFFCCFALPWYAGTLTQWGRCISHYNSGCLSIHCYQECLMKSPIVHLGEFDENHYSLHFQLRRSCDCAGSSSKF